MKQPTLEDQPFRYTRDERIRAAVSDELAFDDEGHTYLVWDNAIPPSPPDFTAGASRGVSVLEDGKLLTSLTCSDEFQGSVSRVGEFVPVQNVEE